MKLVKSTTKTAQVKKAGKERASKKLPPDSYKPLMEGVKVPVDDARTFVVNLQRGGEDGLVQVDVRTYQTTEAYTGYTKKGINFPLDLLPDLIEALQSVSDAADEKGLYKEFE